MATEISSKNSESTKIDFNYLGSRDEQAETRTVASRKRLREKMQSDVDAFLLRGGKILSVDTFVTADPPSKPTGDYGSRPI